MAEGGGEKAGKEHRKKGAGRKADKKKKTDKKKRGISTEQQRANNPRAFAFQSSKVAKAQKARSAEKEQRRLHGVCVCGGGGVMMMVQGGGGHR